MARPMPVLPEVGSTMVSPGSRTPRDSASTIMLSAGQSLTEPPGLARSSLAHRDAAPWPVKELSRTTGVRPMVSVMLSYFTGLSKRPGRAVARLLREAVGRAALYDVHRYGSMVQNHANRH